MAEQVAAAATAITVTAGSSDGVAAVKAAGGLRGPGDGEASPSRLSIGRYGEDLAATYLKDIGWQVLERNWRPSRGLRGELDIIALDPGSVGRQPEAGGVTGRGDQLRERPTLVFVEVKTRSSLSQGPPAAAVDARKLARLRVLAGAWASSHQVPHADLRLDVVSILLRDARPALVCHHRTVSASWG